MAAKPPTALTVPALGVVPQKRIAVYVVAHNAAQSLSRVLGRIPQPVRERVAEILVFDAGSRDDTYLVGVGYKAVFGHENLTIFRGSEGGLGANSKRALTYCREQGYAIVVLLHADGKYAPEVIADLLAPLERGEVDAVFGSRFLASNPVRHGMPLHKYLAIRLLSALQNRLLGLELSEYHCGYRAYALRAVADLPYDTNSDGLHFDTEIIIQMKQKRLRITEVPVPVYSGEEADAFRGVAYAANVLRVLGQYWLHSRGFREYAKYAVAEKYTYKESPTASHQRILQLLDRDRQHVLDVGCGAGYLAEALAVRGNTVVGVDARRAAGVEERVSRFVQVDLDRETIPWSGPPFAFVVLGDVLEHLREPERLLAQCQSLLADDGRLIVSVPNVAHWSVRLPLLFGRFPYAAKGILDRSHVRFFTLRSARAELDRSGFVVERIETTTAPLEQLFPGRQASPLVRLLTAVQRIGNRWWPGLFAYQIVLRARKRS